jgi:competence ComEA-like helix-hairpin-helix protein
LIYLTRQERLVLIFLACALAAGAAVKVLRGEKAPPPPRPAELEFDLTKAKAPLEAASLAEATAPRKINVNAADAKELRKLPGVGDVFARRIVAHREAHGPFAKAEDLAAVKGIGPATVKKLEPYITCEKPE